MAMPVATNAARPQSVLGIALAGAGLLVLIAGAIWWAWDADPGWGMILVLLGLAIVTASRLLVGSQRSLPTWAVAGIALILAFFGAYEIWHAIATVISQNAPGLR